MVSRNYISLIVALCLLWLGCSPGAPPQFESDGDASGPSSLGDTPLEITFELVEPLLGTSLQLTEEETFFAKVQVTTTRESSTLNGLNIVWCNRNDNETTWNRLCITAPGTATTSPFSCSQLEGIVEADQSQLAFIEGKASELRSVQNELPVFNTKIRARLLEDSVLAEDSDPCATTSAADLTIDVEVVFETEGPPTAIEVSGEINENCPTLNETLRTVIPRDDKGYSPDNQVYTVTFYADDGSNQLKVLQSGEIKWDSSYLCPPENEKPSDQLSTIEAKACLLKRNPQNASDYKKGVEIFATAARTNGTESTVHEKVALCDAFPTCSAPFLAWKVGEDTFLDPGIYPTGELEHLGVDGVIGAIKCSGSCVDVDGDDIRATFELRQSNATVNDDKSINLFTSDSGAYPKSLEGNTNVEHVWNLKSLLQVGKVRKGQELECLIYPFQEGNDILPPNIEILPEPVGVTPIYEYCCEEGVDGGSVGCGTEDNSGVTYTCLATEEMEIRNTHPVLSDNDISILPLLGGAISKSSALVCTVPNNAYEEPDEADNAIYVQFEWQTNDGQLLVLPEGYPTQKSFENGSPLVSDPLSITDQVAIQKGEPICCALRVMDVDTNDGTYVQYRNCQDVENSPPVLIPEAGDELIVQIRPLSFSETLDSPPCTNEAPTDTNPNVSSGGLKDFYAWQPLECVINVSEAVDPDLNDNSSFEARFYACDDKDPQAEWGPQTAPSGFFHNKEGTEVCCEVRACDQGIGSNKLCTEAVSLEDMPGFKDENNTNVPGYVRDTPTLVNKATISVVETQDAQNTTFECSTEAFDCDSALPNASGFFDYSKAVTAVSPTYFEWYTQVANAASEKIDSETDSVITVGEGTAQNLGCGESLLCAGTVALNSNVVAVTGEKSEPETPSNTAPEVIGLSLDSLENPLRTDGTAICSWDGVLDNDGDEIANITVTWLNNGVPLLVNLPDVTPGPGAGSQELILGACGEDKKVDPNDTISCRVAVDDFCNAPSDSTSETIVVKEIQPIILVEDASSAVELTPGSNQATKFSNFECGIHEAAGILTSCNPNNNVDYTVDYTFTDGGGTFTNSLSKAGLQTTAEFGFGNCLTGPEGFPTTLRCTAVIKDGNGNEISSALVTEVLVSDEAPNFQLELVPNEDDFTPVTSSVNEKIDCNVTNITDDDDGFIANITYSWKKGGDLTIPGATSPTLVITENIFDVGDQIRCTATVNDGCHPSNSKTSAPIVVSNTSPIFAAVTLTPQQPFAGDTLTCQASGFSDVDQDSLAGASFVWEADSNGNGTFLPLSTAACASLVLGATDVQSLNLPNCSFTLSPGDNVRCLVTPLDDDIIGSPEEGNPTQSNIITIADTPPSFTSVVIESTGTLPSAPILDTEQSSLTCSAVLDDPDGIDGYTIQYEWQVTQPNGTQGSVSSGALSEIEDIEALFGAQGISIQPCSEIRCTASATAPGVATVSLTSLPIAINKGGSLRFTAQGRSMKLNGFNADGDNPLVTLMNSGTLELIYFLEETPVGGSHQVLLSFEDEGSLWEIRLNSNNQLTLNHDGVDIISSALPLKSSDWNFVGLRWSPTSISLFVDGTGTGVGTSTSVDLTTLTFSSETPGTSLRGYLDEVRLSNVPISPTTTESIYFNVPGQTFALFHFEMDTTVLPADYSGNQLHGIFPGAPPQFSHHSLANTCNQDLCTGSAAECILSPEVDISLTASVLPGESQYTITCAAAGALDLLSGPVGSYEYRLVDADNGLELSPSTLGGSAVQLDAPISFCRNVRCEARAKLINTLSANPGLSVSQLACPPSTEPLVDFACDDGELCSNDAIAADNQSCQHSANAGVPCVGNCGDGESALCTEDSTCECQNVCTQDAAGPCEVVVFDATDPLEPCKLQLKPNGSSCVSESLCVPENTAGTCDGGGICNVGQALATFCNDNNGCTIDSCSQTGCINAATTDPCDDGDACTINDTCFLGDCLSSQALVCDDGKQCTFDSCDENLGCEFIQSALENSLCNDGDACTTVDTCISGNCLPLGNDVICDDGKQCTVDSCDVNGGCIFSKKQTGTLCDDGLLCKELDFCKSDGDCAPGPQNINCDDGNLCTQGDCSDVTGCNFTPESNGSLCDDGNSCTENDVCSAGLCQSVAVNCDDDEVCTSDFCTNSGGCQHVSNDLLNCNDGNACTEGDFCSASICEPGVALTCDDGNPCTFDECEALTGCLFVPATNGCDDGNACTTLDLCANSACVGGSPKPCIDGDICTTDGTCNTVSGDCSFPPAIGVVLCDDGDICSTDDVCSGGECVGTAETQCDDSNACTVDTCEAIGGCTHVVPANNCDDGNPCTTDQCLPNQGCTNTNIVAPCDDGNPCTEGDTCDLGVCTFTSGIDCDDGNVCTVDNCDITGSGCTFSIQQGFPCDDGDVCTESANCQPNGTCGAGAPISCDDDNACTIESCVDPFGCTITNVPGTCEDGSACTDADFCLNGSCLPGNQLLCDFDGTDCSITPCDPTTGCGLPVPADSGIACDDGITCTENDSCAGVTDTCAGTALVCDDGDLCTDDACFEGIGCTFTNNFASCSDGDLCTVNDICTQGICVGDTLDCDDNNSCTATSCNAIQGCLTETLSGISCEDGLPCTENDICLNGTCSPGNPLDCDDANVCTTDSCNPAVGCQNLGTTALCDDDDLCTTDDQCAPLGSTSACLGVVVSCPELDTNDCTTATCDPAVGCIVQNNTDFCDDGNACGAPDACSGGSCIPGPPVICGDGLTCTVDAPCSASLGCVYNPDSSLCNDSNTCTVDTCDGVLGCQFTNVLTGTACDDGNTCTESDTCNGGTCQSGTPLDCNDGVGCTGDTCANLSGCSNTENDAACEDGISCTTDSCEAATGCSHAANSSLCDDGNPCTGDLCDPTNGCIDDGSNELNSCDDGDSCTDTDVCTAGVCQGSSLTCCLTPLPANFCGEQHLVPLSVGASEIPCSGGSNFDSSNGNFCAYPSNEFNNEAVEVCVQGVDADAFYIFEDSSSAPQSNQCLAEIAPGNCLPFEDFFGASQSLVVSGYGNGSTGNTRVHFRCPDEVVADCDGSNVAELLPGGLRKCTTDNEWSDVIDTYNVNGGPDISRFHREHRFNVPNLESSDDVAVWVRGFRFQDMGTTLSELTDSLTLYGAFVSPGTTCDSSVATQAFTESANPLLVGSADWASAGASPGDELCVFVEFTGPDISNDKKTDLIISVGLSQ